MTTGLASPARRACLGAALAGALLPAWAPPVHASTGSLWRLTDEFVDEYDQRVRLSDLPGWAGSHTVVAMDSAECRFICSTQWRKLMQIQAAADQHKLPVRFVIISLDHANDTPALWRAYRKEKGLVRKNWRFLTGRREGTERAAATLGVKWWTHEGHIIHDFRIVRLNEAGQIAAAMETFDLTPREFLGA